MQIGRKNELHSKVMISTEFYHEEFWVIIFSTPFLSDRIKTTIFASTYESILH